MSVEEKQILNEENIYRAVARISHEILERNHDLKDLVIVGIRTRGVTLAERILKHIFAIEHKKIPLGILDITFYRDDLGEIGPHPVVHETEMPFDVTEKIVVLIDDVLYTGRTVRAALNALNDFGRPRAIQFAALIDRGHRELPIKADYVGKNIPTSREEQVIVRFKESDGVDEAVIVPKEKS